MPVMAIYSSENVSPADYAAFRAKLPLTAAPQGALVHAHGATPTGFVTFEVWEDRAALERFLDDILAPTVEAAGLPLVRPKVVDVDDFIVTPGCHDREIPFGDMAAGA